MYSRGGVASICDLATIRTFFYLLSAPFTLSFVPHYLLPVLPVHNFFGSYVNGSTTTNQQCPFWSRGKLNRCSRIFGSVPKNVSNQIAVFEYEIAVQCGAALWGNCCCVVDLYNVDPLVPVSNYSLSDVYKCYTGIYRTPPHPDHFLEYLSTENILGQSSSPIH